MVMLEPCSRQLAAPADADHVHAGVAEAVGRPGGHAVQVIEQLEGSIAVASRPAIITTSPSRHLDDAPAPPGQPVG
jgi:hypothetical protein